ncbi:hypothetical protein Tco_0145203 [Tanacetum coccineum]
MVKTGIYDVVSCEAYVVVGVQRGGSSEQLPGTMREVYGTVRDGRTGKEWIDPDEENFTEVKEDEQGRTNHMQMRCREEEEWKAQSDWTEDVIGVNREGKDVVVQDNPTQPTQQSVIHAEPTQQPTNEDVAANEDVKGKAPVDEGSNVAATPSKKRNRQKWMDHSYWMGSSQGFWDEAMHRTPKSFGPEFQLYLIEGTRDEVSDQHSYCFNVEDDPKTFDEAMESRKMKLSLKEQLSDEK